MRDFYILRAVLLSLSNSSRRGSSNALYSTRFSSGMSDSSMVASIRYDCGMPKAWHIFSTVLFGGKDLPVSIEHIAFVLMPHRSASWVCVKPFFRRSVLIACPTSIFSFELIRRGSRTRTCDTGTKRLSGAHPTIIYNFRRPLFYAHLIRGRLPRQSGCVTSYTIPR